MKRLGLGVVLLCACGDEASTPQASPAPADAMPTAVEEMEFVAPVDAAPVEARPVDAAPAQKKGKPSIGAQDPEPRDIGDAAQLPAFRFQLTSKQALDATSLPVETVVNKIRSAYMASLKRCYKQTWKDDPTAAGALTLAFTVTDAGRVTDARATGPVGKLDECFEAAMPKWTFPVPDAARARFEIGFELRID